jgi:hypothetical protein
MSLSHYFGSKSTNQHMHCPSASHVKFCDSTSEAMRMITNSRKERRQKEKRASRKLPVDGDIGLDKAGDTDNNCISFMGMNRRSWKLSIHKHHALGVIQTCDICVIHLVCTSTQHSYNLLQLHILHKNINPLYINSLQLHIVHQNNINPLLSIL